VEDAAGEEQGGGVGRQGRCAKKNRAQVAFHL
jgi:hypothetical protein